MNKGILRRRALVGLGTIPFFVPRTAKSWLVGKSAAPAESVGVPLIYTGTGASLAVTGAGFQPNLVIIKSRTSTTGWRWTDSVRGVTKRLSSQSSAAEVTEVDGLTSFDADGFTVGTDTDYNVNGTNYLALAIREIAAGFNIVTYTGNGVAGSTVAHGLGVAPNLIIVKSRSTIQNWPVYPGAVANPEQHYMLLDTAGVKVDSNVAWNDVAPTSTEFTLGTLPNTNAATYVAWLFANKTGAISTGVYTGNGTASGPVVTTGFQPKFVIVKRTNVGSENWRVFDNIRSSNPHEVYSTINLADAELTLAGGCSMQATSFQFLTSDARVNALGSEYLYLSIR